jgi:hypothetical protein
VNVDPGARLLFWLRISFVADGVFILISIALIASGEPSGWYLLAFTALRAILGAIGLFWVAPKVLERRSAATEQPDDF